MIEAVGREFLNEYWSIVERCMKARDSVGVVQVITIPEPRESRVLCDSRRVLSAYTGFERYIREIDFIRKWVRV